MMIPTISLLLAGVAAEPAADGTPQTISREKAVLEAVAIRDPRIYDGTYQTNFGTMIWKDGKGTFDSPKGTFEVDSKNTDYEFNSVYIRWTQFDSSIPPLNNPFGRGACKDGKVWGRARLDFDEERNSFGGLYVLCDDWGSFRGMDWDGERIRVSVGDTQQLPMVYKPGAAEGVRHRQLPPVDRPGAAVSLNPQPLPPVELDGGAAAALNPQPLPPVDSRAGAVALNPQPLPPVELDRGAAAALNPQPLPPVDSRAGAVALHPQALPPVSTVLTTTATSARVTCQSGYVWREASADDHVCVTPQSRAFAAEENAAAASRVVPAGAYGPNTCIAGFVWREAFHGDAVCVTPERRQAVSDENSQAAVRKL